MVATINGNPQATVFSCYSPTNVHEETEVESFYQQLTSITRQVPKHNVLLIGGDFNAQLGQDEGYKFAYHLTTNRNGTMLNNFLKENKLLCLNTSFQKKVGQVWTHRSPTGAKSQLDYVIINTKWRNSVKDSRAYNSFQGVSSDHRVVTVKIRLSIRASIRATKPKSSCNPVYDWSTLKKKTQIGNSFTLKLKNRFDVLQQ